MADKPMNLRDLRRVVKKHGGWEDTKRGKGSHTMFFREVAGNVFSYPIPTHEKEVKKCYVKGLRERLKLTEADGVKDSDFYE